MTATILDRITKLMALANGNSNPNEASSALAKAQQLMEEHNLTLGMLERNKIGELEVASTQSVSKVKDWEYWIVDSVAKTFGCSMMWRSGNSYAKDPFGRFVFVGPKVNLQLVEYAATFLLRKIVEGRREFNTRLPSYLSRQEKTLELDGFCKGYASAVWHKVQALKLPDSTTAAIKDYVETTANGKKPKSIQARTGSDEGYWAGKEAGDGLDLNRPMSAGEGQFQLGAK